MAVTNHSCHNYTEMTCHQADALCTTQTQKIPHCHWVLWSVSWYVVENTLVQTGFKLLKEIIFRSKQIPTVLMFGALRHKASDVRMWLGMEAILSFFLIFYTYSCKYGLICKSPRCDARAQSISHSLFSRQQDRIADISFDSRLILCDVSAVSRMVAPNRQDNSCADFCFFAVSGLQYSILWL